MTVIQGNFKLHRLLNIFDLKGFLVVVCCPQIFFANIAVSVKERTKENPLKSNVLKIR